MSWAKLSDTICFDPRVLDAGDEAFGFWTRAYSYCAAHLTDGHVPRSAAMHLAGARRRLDALARTGAAVGGAPER